MAGIGVLAHVYFSKEHEYRPKAENKNGPPVASAHSAALSKNKSSSIDPPIVPSRIKSEPFFCLSANCNEPPTLNPPPHIQEWCAAFQRMVADGSGTFEKMHLFWYPVHDTL
jgi:hypothetical protein